MLANQQNYIPIVGSGREVITKYIRLYWLASDIGAVEYETKPAANGDDLQSLRFLWIEGSVIYNCYRVQVARFLLLASFIASRSEAILGGSHHWQSNESLEYGEIKVPWETDEIAQ